MEINYSDREVLEQIFQRYKFIEEERAKGNELAAVVLMDIETIHSTVTLTPRERNILRYLRKGFTQQEVAELVGFDVRNYRRHMNSILDKFQERIEIGDYYLSHSIMAPETQVCNDCGREFPLTPDYFYRNKSAKHGYRTKCKVCVQRRRGGNFYNPLTSLNWGEGNKFCSTCGCAYPDTNRFFSSNKCKNCFNKHFSFITYVPDIITCRICGEVKDRFTRSQICQECNNAEGRRYYRQNKAQHNKATERWRENNPDKIREYMRRAYHKRRQRHMQYGATLTIEEYEDTLNHFKHSCAYCGKPEQEHLEEIGERLHQDHIKPISKGGGYTKNNIVPACRACNTDKHIEEWKEWYKRQPFFSRERYNSIKHIIRQ